MGRRRTAICVDGVEPLAKRMAPTQAESAPAPESLATEQASAERPARRRLGAARSSSSPLSTSKVATSPYQRVKAAPKIAGKENKVDTTAQRRLGTARPPPMSLPAAAARPVPVSDEQGVLPLTATAHGTPKTVKAATPKKKAHSATVTAQDQTAWIANKAATVLKNLELPAAIDAVTESLLSEGPLRAIVPQPVGPAPATVLPFCFGASPAMRSSHKVALDAIFARHTTAGADGEGVSASQQTVQEDQEAALAFRPASALRVRPSTRRASEFLQTLDAVPPEGENADDATAQPLSPPCSLEQHLAQLSDDSSDDSVSGNDENDSLSSSWAEDTPSEADWWDGVDADVDAGWTEVDMSQGWSEGPIPFDHLDLSTRALQAEGHQSSQESLTEAGVRTNFCISGLLAQLCHETVTEKRFKLQCSGRLSALTNTKVLRPGNVTRLPPTRPVRLQYTFL